LRKAIAQSELSECVLGPIAVEVRFVQRYTARASVIFERLDLQGCQLCRDLEHESIEENRQQVECRAATGFDSIAVIIVITPTRFNETACQFRAVSAKYERFSYWANSSVEPIKIAMAAKFSSVIEPG